LVGSRDSLRDGEGTALVSSAGKETMDAAITGGRNWAGVGSPMDINLDGIPDIVLAVSNGHNLVYHGTGDGNFIATSPLEIGATCTGAYSGEVGSPETTPPRQLGIDVDGEVAADTAGHAVAMNRAGDKMVVAEPKK